MIKPNYYEAQKATRHLLLQFDVNSLPVPLKNIYKSFSNLKVRTYTWFADIHNITIEEAIIWVDSDSGCCWKQGEDKYLILYNNTINNIGHIRWTIAHEFAHYVLKHHDRTDETIIQRYSLTIKNYNILEKEANCFARELMAPFDVLLGLNDSFNVLDLMEWCNVSKDAAKNILKFYNTGVQMGRRFDPYNEIVQLLAPFTYRVNHEKYCPKCKHYFVVVNAKFCPVCGNDKLSRGKGSNIMVYSCYELNENGRAVICPRCENEEIVDDYCHVCGSYMLNKCTGFKDEPENRYRGPWHIEFEHSCGTFLPGNARFCTNCGNTSSFYESGLLNNWAEAKKENEEKSSKYNELQIAASDDPFR